MTPSTVAALIDAHADALRLYARQWTACPDDAVQAAFGKLAALHYPPADPPAWLFRAVRNAAIDAGRADRRRAKREAIASRPEAWFAADPLEAREAVAALESLPPDQREVIVARVWGGLTLQQAADAVGCSVSTAHRRYEAGLAALRQKLGEPCPNPTR